MGRTDTVAFVQYAVEITAYFWVVAVFTITAAYIGYNWTGAGIAGSTVQAALFGSPVLLAGSFALMYKVVRDAVADATEEELDS